MPRSSQNSLRSNRPARPATWTGQLLRSGGRHRAGRRAMAGPAAQTAKSEIGNSKLEIRNSKLAAPVSNSQFPFSNFETLPLTNTPHGAPGEAPAKRRSWRKAPGREPPARWACSPPRAGSGTRKPAARDAPTAAGHRPGQPLPDRSRRPVTAARSPEATAPRCAPPQDSGFGVRGSGFGNSRRGDRLGSPDVFSRTPSLASRLQDSGFGVRDSGIPDVGTGQVRPMLFHEPRVPNPESRLWRSAPKATAAGPRLPPRPNGDRRRPSR